MSIKLSRIDLGGKFENEAYETLELTHITKDNSVFLFEYPDGGATLTDEDGINKVINECSIVKKHDDRPWLKDLPPAEWFQLLLVDDIQCNSMGQWMISRNHTGAKDISFNIDNNFMPTLKGQEYEKSKISIKDLAEWQLNRVVK